MYVAFLSVFKYLGGVHSGKKKLKFRSFEGVITCYWVMNVRFLLDHDVTDGLGLREKKKGKKTKLRSFVWCHNLLMGYECSIFASP